MVNSLTNFFEDVSLVDRRSNPSHGYRAIHVIARHVEKLVEIQVRTSLQHAWAELSEKMSDVFDPAIKYGGGEESLRELLSVWADVVDTEENVERVLAGARHRVDELLSQGELSGRDQTELFELQADIVKQVANQATRAGKKFEIHA